MRYVFARRFAPLLALLAIGDCGPVPEEEPDIATGEAVPIGAAPAAATRAPGSGKRQGGSPAPS